MMERSAEHGTQTNENSLRILSKVIVGKLENAKMIEFNPANRNDLREAFYRLLNNFMLTEQGLVNQVRGEIEAKMGKISDAELTQTEAFKMRKRALKEQYEDNKIVGFYLKTSLKDLATKAGDFFLRNSLVEEVFADDDEMRKLVLTSISTFDESKVAT